MSELKGIPVVAESAPVARKKKKYVTPQGFTAIKDGIKPKGEADRRGLLGKPRWLKAPLAAGAGYERVRRAVHEHSLATVCEEAKCPNIGECWNAGTATIMLMGKVCTRACRFCSVDTGNPRGWLDHEEPQHAARTVALMKLRYVVLTSVDRDDLPDGGAAHYAACIRAIKAVRVALVVRSEDVAKADAVNATLVNQSAWIFNCAANDATCQGRIQLDNTVLQDYGRYRIYEATIPLRNAIWNQS